MFHSGTINLFGRLKGLIFHEPTIDHLLFFRFLLISKSYEIAHLIRIKKIKKSSIDIEDIDDVLKIYDLVGDIYKVSFQVWWAKTGQNIFYEKTEIKKLTLTIDLSKGQSYVLERVRKAITETYAINQRKDSSKMISFEINKIRPISLFHKFELIREKSKLLRNPNAIVSNWRLGVRVGFGSKYIRELRNGIDKVDEANRVRNYLGIFITQKLSEAKLIAENAARGKFPSNKTLATAQDFNFSNLNEVISKADFFENDVLRMQRGGKPKPLNYFDELAKACN